VSTYTFLFPLIIGFAFNLASAFTLVYSRCWGERRGKLITAIFRNVLGIPVWAVGFWMATRTPSPELFSPNNLTDMIGWSLILVGGVLILAALVSLRSKAALPSVGDALVDRGLYAYVRNPIHSGTILEFAGIALLFPTLAVFIACVFGVFWVLLQTHFDEYDLQQRIPAYHDYMRRVPRFIPHRKVQDSPH